MEDGGCVVMARARAYDGSSNGIHMKYKLKKIKDEILRIVEMVSYTKSLGVMDVEFASEDSARSNSNQRDVRKAINAGARQVEITINGIGERAGNAPLEEVVMALKCRGKDLLGGLYTGINTKNVVMANNMVLNFGE
ncbi:hypothetical protein LguiA_013529 [Lonicera macranthoides]